MPETSGAFMGSPGRSPGRRPRRRPGRRPVVPSWNLLYGDRDEIPDLVRGEIPYAVPDGLRDGLRDGAPDGVPDGAPDGSDSLISHGAPRRPTPEPGPPRLDESCLPRKRYRRPGIPKPPE